VTVDLGSSAGGRDLLARIENVRGGAGDDDLSGDGRPNVIDGGPGADVMNGQGGGDRFRTSGFDDIDCGNGADAVLPTPSEDYLVEPDCETVQPTLAGGPLPAQPTSVTADAVTMQLPCGGDPATLTTPAGPRRYDREGPFGVDVAAGSCDTPLALTDEGRALARPAVVRVAFGDSGWHFRLPAP
jgi:Ca2+-binding RTX toxin-like protein